MLKDSETPRYAARRTHRTYTPEFKAQLVAACLKPGASIAALARANGMNANVLHRWLQEHGRSGAHQLGKNNPAHVKPANPSAQIAQTRASELPAFIALPLPASPPAQAPTIRIEIQRAASSAGAAGVASATIIVNWPVQDGAACAQWLRECVQ